MQRFKTFALGLLGLLGLLLFGALVAGVAWTIYALFQFLGSVPKELAAALVAAIAAVTVATITVMVGRYYERKKELDALYRDKKTEIYDEFLQKFFALFNADGGGTASTPEQDLVPFLREFTRKLVLWSGPDVIEAFVKWKDHLAKGMPDAEAIFLTESFLRAIREDLRHSNRGLRRGFFARLFLKEGALFLALSEKNPNLTLAALAEAEKLLAASKNANGGA